MYTALILAGVFFTLGWYLLFRDTMNRIQYIERFGIYWIIRDDGRTHAAYQPYVMRAFMRQTAKPYWYGTGVQFRAFKWTFQAGRLGGKGEGPQSVVGRGGWLPTDPSKLERFGDDTSFRS